MLLFIFIIISYTISTTSAAKLTMWRKALVDEFTMNGDCGKLDAVYHEVNSGDTVCRCEIVIMNSNIKEFLKGTLYLSTFGNYRCYYGDIGKLAGIYV